MRLHTLVAGMALWLLCPLFVAAQSLPTNVFGEQDATGHYRLLYRPQAVPPGLAPIAAGAYVLRHDPRLGLSSHSDAFVLEQVRHTPAGTHLRYRQMWHGVPVHSATAHVHLAPSGQPLRAEQHAARGLFDAPKPTPPSVTSAAARRQARATFTEPTAAAAPQLIALPKPSPRLAWHVVVWPKRGGEFAFLIDATTGTLLERREQTLHDRVPEAEQRGARSATDSALPPLRGTPRPSRMPPPTAGTLEPATGSGLVFLPDPLSSAGVAYAPPYVDQGDADVPELNAERMLVDLPGLSLTNRLYRLAGPYVTITGVDALGETVYTPPAEANPHGFRYTRSDPRFEAVNAYYHIDRSQRYVQTLGFNDLLNTPLSVNPHAYRLDNAQYLPSKKMLLFGDGGVDDAEDASVIWHEYAHALLDDAAPGLAETVEGNALHEGVADYWAASFRRRLGLADWSRLFAWDGNTDTFRGRIVGAGGRYPDDFTFDAANPYADGLQWAGVLMALHTRMATDVVDRLVLASLHFLTAPTTFAHAADALLQADAALYDGRYASVLLDELGRRGYIDPADYGPLLAHEQPVQRHPPGSTLTLDVVAMSRTAEVGSVSVTYGYGLTSETLPMVRVAGDTFRVAIRLTEDVPGSVEPVLSYVFRATATDGTTARLPASGDFRVTVGNDTAGPVIEHVEPEALGLVGWPFDVVARVDDQSGVDSVWVTFAVNGQTGEFSLTGAKNTYSSRFPDLPVGVGNELRYEIHARDRTGLLTVAPFAFVLSDAPLVRAYDFQQPVPGLVANGLWQHGAAAYGYVDYRPGVDLSCPCTGRDAALAESDVPLAAQQVWGTVLDGPYPARETHSTLTLPTFDLSDAPQAYLVFQHWYDTGHGGEARPGTQDAVLYDAGNVKVSTDGGLTWAVATPVRGYNGFVISSFGSPALANEAAFGGFSYGWQRAVVPLPLGPDVRVRFDFGTNADNDETARYFAGWLLDDVRVVTEVPDDAEAPRVVAPLPPASQEAASAQFAAPPAVSVTVADDLGLQHVVVHFTAAFPNGTARDSTYLEQVQRPQRPGDPVRYHGLLPIASAFAFPGLEVDYYFTLTDYAGRRTRYPADGTSLQLLYYRYDQRDLLDQALLTGAWQLGRTGWHTATAQPVDAGSALVFERVDVPVNAVRAQFVLRHRYAFEGEETGTVERSTDGGYTWDTLAFLSRRSGEASDGTLETVAYDLTAQAGQQVWLRLVAPTNPDWTVGQASLQFRTTDDAFTALRTFALTAPFPNPARNQATVSFTLERDETVRLTLYDATGRRLRDLADGTLPAGTYTRTLDLTGLAAGTYFLRLTTAQQRATQPIVKL